MISNIYVPCQYFIFTFPDNILYLRSLAIFFFAIPQADVIVMSRGKASIRRDAHQKGEEFAKMRMLVLQENALITE